MNAPAKIARLKREVHERSERRAAKRLELAQHAIATLAQLGYARTSLRDIAEQSGCSVGLIHYYFVDKIDLISFCVRIYKRDFVEALDEAMATAPSHEAVAERFVEGLVDAVQREAQTHRLWYDIRTQALFDEQFHDVVEEIEQELVAMIGRLLDHLACAAVAPQDAYVALDGTFRFYLYRALRSESAAADELRQGLWDVLVRQGAVRRPAR